MGLKQWNKTQKPSGRECLTQPKGVTLIPKTWCLIASIHICNVPALQLLLGLQKTNCQEEWSVWGWESKGAQGGELRGVDKRNVCSVSRGVKVNLIRHVYSGRGATQEHLHPVAWPHLLQFWVSFPFAREITARIWKQWMEEVTAISFSRGRKGVEEGQRG